MNRNARINIRTTIARTIHAKILAACPDAAAQIDESDVFDYLNICESEGIQWAGRKGAYMLQDMLSLFGRESANG